MIRRLRLELFVDDLDRSVAFYRDALGFALERRDRGYASMRAGDVVLGLGRLADLPATDATGGFARDQFAKRPGAGVEIVLEVDDLRTAYEKVLDARVPVVEAVRDRPWGQADFRVLDPDGYYVRVAQYRGA